jgi:hypothetical protein
VEGVAQLREDPGLPMIEAFNLTFSETRYSDVRCQYPNPDNYNRTGSSFSKNQTFQD